MQKRFLTLDALRGVAALTVMAAHTGGIAGRALPASYLSVDFFFVLSGFVLAHAYGDGVALRHFVRARLIRLYPLYFAGTLLGVGATLIAGRSVADVGLALLLGLAFLPSMTGGTPPHLYMLDPPAWSLFFEILANLIWFPLRRAFAGLFGLLFLSAFVLAILILDVAYGGVAGGGAWSNLPGGIARVGLSFTAGALTLAVWRRSAFRPSSPWWAPVVVFIVLVALPVSRRLADPPTVLLMPALVYLAACTEPVARWSTALSRRLGDASYAVYLLHYPILITVGALLIDRLREAGFVHPSLVTSPLVIILSLAAALTLDAVYDRPLRRWLSGDRSRSSRAKSGGRIGAVPAPVEGD